MMQFGQAQPGRTYVRRPGVYGVILRDDGMVGVVKTPVGFYLPGGGIEAGEDMQAALIRECREETGYEAEIIREIGQAAQYVDVPSKNMYVNKIGKFFLIRLGKKTGDGETDHQLVWMTREEADRQLMHEFLRWAVVHALSSRTSDHRER